MVFISVITGSIADYLTNTSIWRERNKYYSVLIKNAFCEKKLPLIEKFKDKIFKLF